MSNAGARLRGVLQYALSLMIRARAYFEILKMMMKELHEPSLSSGCGPHSSCCLASASGPAAGGFSRLGSGQSVASACSMMCMSDTFHGTQAVGIISGPRLVSQHLILRRLFQVQVDQKAAVPPRVTVNVTTDCWSRFTWTPDETRLLSVLGFFLRSSKTHIITLMRAAPSSSPSEGAHRLIFHNSLNFLLFQTSADVWEGDWLRL